MEGDVDITITEIIKYMEKNCSAQLKVQDISGVFRISIRKLEKLFNSETGMNVRDFIKFQLLMKLTNLIIQDVLKVLRGGGRNHQLCIVLR